MILCTMVRRYVPYVQGIDRDYRLLFHISKCEGSLSKLLTCSRSDPGLVAPLVLVGLERKARSRESDA
jgi:hypothetical protein